MIELTHWHKSAAKPIVAYERMAPTIRVLVAVQSRKPRTGAKRTRTNDDVADVVDRHVLVEEQRVERVRFKGHDRIDRDMSRRMNGMPPDVRADIDEDSRRGTFQVMINPRRHAWLMRTILGYMPADPVAPMNDEGQLRITGLNPIVRTPRDQPSSHKGEHPGRAWNSKHVQQPSTRRGTPASHFRLQLHVLR